jgi:hypothetical protein
MNVDILIQWGQNMLAFLDRAEESTLFEREQVQEKLGWITEFRQPLEEWKVLLQVVMVTESYVGSVDSIRGFTSNWGNVSNPRRAPSKLRRFAQN